MSEETKPRGFSRLGRPLRKPPEGYQEMPGGMHLGGGIWLIRYDRIPVPTPTEENDRG